MEKLPTPQKKNPSLFLILWSVHPQFPLLPKVQPLYTLVPNQALEIEFGVKQKSLQTVTAAMKLKDACSLKENYDKSRLHTKKQRKSFCWQRSV